MAKQVITFEAHIRVFPDSSEEASQIFTKPIDITLVRTQEGGGEPVYTVPNSVDPSFEDLIKHSASVFKIPVREIFGIETDPEEAEEEASES